METTYWIYSYVEKVNQQYKMGTGLLMSRYNHFDYIGFYKHFPNSIVFMTQQISEDYYNMAEKYFESRREKERNSVPKTPEPRPTKDLKRM